jgi:hypothetical protein
MAVFRYPVASPQSGRASLARKGNDNTPFITKTRAYRKEGNKKKGYFCGIKSIDLR